MTPNIRDRRSPRHANPWRQALPAAALFAWTALVAAPAAATIYRYDTTSSGAIPETAATVAACTSGGLSRTFSVSNSFTVANIALGLNISHSRRGDLAAVLYAPDGSYAIFMQPAGGNSANYDVMISSNSDGGGNPPLNDGTADPTGEPYYARLVNYSGADFYTGNASGTWTLYLCDVVSGTTGTLNRARLVLRSSNAVPNVCTSTVSYEWGDNGNNNPFSSASVGDVTLSLSSTRDLTNDEVTVSGRIPFTTQTSVFGGEAGHYLMQYDDGANGLQQDPEAVLLESNWHFSVPVRDLTWKHLDVDNGSWEDYLRTDGYNSSGAFVPYSATLGSVDQLAGDVVETDGSNVASTSTAGNVSYVFGGAVSDVRVQYMRGDDFSNPAEQRIGIGNPTFCAYDFGDAPNSYGDQLTNGPRHVLGDRLLYMGTNPPDGEADGQPNSSASGDDGAQVGGVDDEDGVSSFPACPDDRTYSVTVKVTNNSGSDGYLVGYVDWDRDGAFNTGDERSATVTVPTGTNGSDVSVTWSSVPRSCGGVNATYARFRFTTSQTRAESPTDGGGLYAPDGEVEDYELAASTLPVTVAQVATERRAGGLDVSFSTAEESRNAAFRIWDLTPGREPAILATIPAQGVDSFKPHEYRAHVEAAGIGAIGIEDVAVDGQGRLHGPFQVGRSVGERPQHAAIDWPAIQAETGVRPLSRMLADAQAGRAGQRAGLAPKAGQGGPPTNAALLLVSEAGIQRVTYEALAAAGVDLEGVAAARIAVLDQGKGVPVYVGPGPLFGPGSYVEFLADPKTTLASPVDYFELRVGAASSERVLPSPTRRRDRIGTTRAELRRHPDNLYSPSSPNGDPWYDAALRAVGAPDSLSRDFDLPDLASGNVKLTVDLWGYAHLDGATPDHHVIVRLNGVQLDSVFFDGLTPWSGTYDVTALVQASGNHLELSLPDDTGYPFDLVNLEGYSVDYPRATRAIDGRFHADLTSNRTVAVGGFDDTEPVVVWLQTGHGSHRSPGGPADATLPAGLAERGRFSGYLRSEVRPVNGKVAVPGFAASADLSTTSRLFHPAVVAGVPQPLSASDAQYLIITHPAFAESLDRLVALEQSRGLDTEVVTVDRIYAAYSDHQPSAEAIHRFVAASEKLYPGRLRDVLLVGADTTDPYDHLGDGSVSYVPTQYVPIVPDVSFSPTDELLVDGDGDGVGDLPVGRLPVRSPSELEAVVDKLYAWEDRVASGRDALLIAGASDSGRTLSDLNESYAASLSGWNVALAQVDDSGEAAVRQATLAALDAGTPLVSFVGHSSISVWELTPILHWQDVASLTNTGRPDLVLQWGCWSSYYVEPATECVSSSLLRTPDVGAAGTIGATTLTSEASNQRLGTLFFDQVAAGAETVGEALHQAKVALHAEGSGEDGVLGMSLLGDPAMSLQPPPAP